MLRIALVWPTPVVGTRAAWIWLKPWFTVVEMADGLTALLPAPQEVE